MGFLYVYPIYSKAHVNNELSAHESYKQLALSGLLCVYLC